MDFLACLVAVFEVPGHPYTGLEQSPGSATAHPVTSYQLPGLEKGDLYTDEERKSCKSFCNRQGSMNNTVKSQKGNNVFDGPGCPASKTLNRIPHIGSVRPIDRIDHPN